MDDAIIDAINCVVMGNDILYILGDVLFGHSKVETWLEIRKRIVCKDLRLCFGNHDHQIRKHKQLQDTFTSVCNVKETTFCGVPLVLYHYPILVWNHMQDGRIHLHGHCHGTLHPFINAYLPQARILDVYADQNRNYKPWSLTEVQDYMSDRPGMTIDHHI